MCFNDTADVLYCLEGGGGGHIYFEGIKLKFDYKCLFDKEIFILF